MLRFILAKLLYLIPTMLGITLVAFGFIRLLPGDPVLLMAGERGVSPERYAQIAAQLGYDKPIWQQYLNYLGNLLQGDLGNSLVTKKPVLAEFLALFPATVELALVAIVIATVIGVPVGVIAAIKRGSWFDQISLTGALVAAGAVVVHDVPDFALVAGTPARRIGWVGPAGRRLEDEGDGRWRCPVTRALFVESGGQLREAGDHD